MKLSTIIRYLVDQSTAVLVPSCRCLFCGAASKSKDTICQGCFEDLPWLTHCCAQCAEPLPPKRQSRHTPSRCGRCLKKPPAFDQTLCPLRYEFPVNRLIQQLKTQAKPEVVELASLLFASRWQDSIQQEPPDLLMPVPLHYSRLYQRGYNQSLELTRSLSRLLNIPFESHNVSRIIAGADQKDLNAKARQRNLKRAFTMNHKPEGRHIAVVDDVMTTGATADAVARVLKKSGVRRVDIWCVGRTPFTKL